uniref:Collagen triple helix repeat protein n=1 Tax=Globodera pallida TaxID=36090 RepID=A0A183CR18_GLOPA
SCQQQRHKRQTEGYGASPTGAPVVSGGGGTSGAARNPHPVAAAAPVAAPQGTCCGCGQSAPGLPGLPGRPGNDGTPGQQGSNGKNGPDAPPPAPAPKVELYVTFLLKGIDIHFFGNFNPKIFFQAEKF